MRVIKKKKFGVQDQRGEDVYFTEMCSGSEAGSHLRLRDFVYHSTLGLRVKKKKKGRLYLRGQPRFRTTGSGFGIKGVWLCVLELLVPVEAPLQRSRFRLGVGVEG